MNRSLSKRETVLLVIMILLIIGIGYYKFILEPINSSVDNYMMMTQDEQDQIMQNTALIQKKKAMEAELETLFAQGTPTPIPNFDNSGILMVELHSILDDSLDYTLSFGDTSSLKCGYLLRRPIKMEFRAADYYDARRIINRIHGSDNISQISDLEIALLDRDDNGEGAVKVTMVVTYFELA